MVLLMRSKELRMSEHIFLFCWGGGVGFFSGIAFWILVSWRFERKNDEAIE